MPHCNDIFNKMYVHERLHKALNCIIIWWYSCTYSDLNTGISVLFNLTVYWEFITSKTKQWMLQSFITLLMFWVSVLHVLFFFAICSSAHPSTCCDQTRISNIERYPLLFLVSSSWGLLFSEQHWNRLKLAEASLDPARSSNTRFDKSPD